MARWLSAVFVLFGGCTATLDDPKVCDPPMCEEVIEHGALPPGCTRATWECATACGDSEICLETCLRSEPVPSQIDCYLCVLAESAVCGRDNGCRCEWDDLRCCRAAHSCSLGECPECAAEQDAFDACFGNILTLCVDKLEYCVAE